MLKLVCACMRARGIAGRRETRESGPEDEDPLVAMDFGYLKFDGTEDDFDDEDDAVAQGHERFLWSSGCRVVPLSGVEFWLVRFARFAHSRASCDCLVMELRVVTEIHRSNTLSVFLCQGGVGCVDHCLFASRVLIACFAGLSACHCVPCPRGQQGGGARCMRGEALRTSVCSCCQAAAGSEKCPIGSAGAIRAITRSPGSRDLAVAWATDFDLGWMGARRPSMEMRACLRDTRQQRINSLRKSVCPRTDVGQPLKSNSPSCSLIDPERGNCWKAALRTCTASSVSRLPHARPRPRCSCRRKRSLEICCGL